MTLLFVPHRGGWRRKEKKKHKQPRDGQNIYALFPPVSMEIGNRGPGDADESQDLLPCPSG